MTHARFLLVIGSACVGLSACGVILDIDPEPTPAVIEGGPAGEGGILDAGDAGDSAVAEAGGDADADANLGCQGAVDCPRFVFVTTDAVSATAVLQGDKICNDVASSASSSPAIRGRKFVAWMSTSTKAATDRLVHGTKPYRLVDGTTVIANDWNDLTDGTIANRLNQTNTGATLAAGFVWTGTKDNGTIANTTCDGWSKDVPGIEGTAGALDVLTQWSEASQPTCDIPLRIYCFEQ